MAASSMKDRKSRAAAVVAVSGVHLALIAWCGLTSPAVPPLATVKVMDVSLVPFTRPTEVPTDMARAPGGGAPAAPSRTHTPPDAEVETIELTAPRELAPEQPLMIGLAPIRSPEPGQGQGGVGTGLGSGVGPGDGPGSGGGTGPILVNGPARAVISEGVQRAALYEIGGSHVVLRCRLRLSQRLERCRIVGEHPTPSGKEREALERVREFRIKPPTRNGRPIDRHLMTVALAFPDPAPEAPEPASPPTG